MNDTSPIDAKMTAGNDSGVSNGCIVVTTNSARPSASFTSLRIKAATTTPSGSIMVLKPSMTVSKVSCMLMIRVAMMKIVVLPKVI